jgi:predicted nucleic acid-binding protein
MNEIIYFDTSALAKWYLNEPRSEDVEAFIQERGPVSISDLTVVEMRCLLSRRRREGHFDRDTELKVFATFQDEVRQGILLCHPIFREIAAAALNLLSIVPEVPLRTLDAFHLAIAREIQASLVATADRVMSDAATALGLGVARFDQAPARRRR